MIPTREAAPLERPAPRHIDQETIDMHTESTSQYLPLEQIADDDRYQPYPNMAPDEFEALLASMQQGFWPTHPLLLDENHRIVCGHMRYKAAKRLRLEQVPVEILSGLSESQKMQQALADNAARRQRLDEDARLAIARQLLSDFGNWSDRAIAGGSGLSPTTVGKLRKARGPGVQMDTSTRIGRDGKRYAAPSTKPMNLEQDEHERLVKDVRSLSGTVPDDIQDEIVAAYERQEYTREKAGYVLGYIDALRARGLLPGKRR